MTNYIITPYHTKVKPKNKNFFQKSVDIMFSLFDNNDLYIIICYDKKCNKTYLKVYKNYNYVMKLIDWCLHENIDFKAYYYKNGKLKELDLL